MTQHLRNPRMPSIPHIQWRADAIINLASLPDAIASLNEAIRLVARENNNRENRVPYAVWAELAGDAVTITAWWCGSASLPTRLRRFDERFGPLTVKQFDADCKQVADQDLVSQQGEPDKEKPT